MRIKDFNISLSHTSIHLDLFNHNDVRNIDHVLRLIVVNKDNSENLRSILCNTSMKYMKRLQEDGLLADKSDSDVVPLFNPVVSDKAVNFINAGGYSALFTMTNKEKQKNSVFRVLGKWWWKFFIPLFVAILATLAIRLWLIK